MASQLSFGQYVSGDSLLHRSHSLFKLLACIVLMVAVCLVSSFQALALVSFAFCTAILASRISFTSLLRSCAPILGLVATTALLHALWTQEGAELLHLWIIRITADGLIKGLLYCFRLALISLLGALLMMTTSPTQFSDAIEQLLSPLKKLGVPTQEFAMILSLGIRFMPILAQDAASIMDAQACRGSSIKEGSVLQRLSAIPTMFIPLFTTSIRHANGLTQALYARSYRPGASRSHWRQAKASTTDYLLLALSLGVLFGVITCIILGF